MARQRVDISEASMRSGDAWIERVREATDIVEIISQTISLKRVGRNWMGLCPFHEEKTASFSVHPERQFYHCFSCKAGGDVFKFVQETEKLGFLEAAELLSRRAGIAVPERRSGERSSRGPLLEALASATTVFEQWLGDPTRGADARTYLELRGIGRETAREFRLGLAPPGWENLVQRLRGRFGEETLVLAGLAMRREGGRTGLYDRFRNRVMLPLVAAGGPVVGFGARALAVEDEPKYLNSPETAVYRKGSFLYGFERARRHADPDGEVVVVEGYFDVIALHQAGLRNVVATSGTALTTDQARILKRVATRVALTFDGDQAGQAAVMRSLGTLLGEGLEVVVVEVPSGEDPDSLVRRGGAKAWAELRASACDPIEFIQRHGLRARGSGEPREQALRAVVGLVVEVKDPIRAKLLIERASQVFGLGEGVLSRAVSLQRGGFRADRPIAAALREQVRGEGHVERELLQALILSPEQLEGVRRQVSPEDFRDPACAALARRLWAGGSSELDAEAAALMRELTATAREETDWVSMATGGALRLVRRRLERRYKIAQRRILELQRQGLGSDPETARLLVESQEIARSISEMTR